MTNTQNYENIDIFSVVELFQMIHNEDDNCNIVTLFFTEHVYNIYLFIEAILIILI